MDVHTLTNELQQALMSVAVSNYHLLIEPIVVLEISTDFVILQHNTQPLADWVSDSYGAIIEKVIAPLDYEWSIQPPPPDEDEKDIKIRELQDLCVTLVTRYEQDRQLLAQALITPIEQMHNSLLSFLRLDISRAVVTPVPLSPKLIIELVEKKSGIKLGNMVGKQPKKETIATADTLHARKVTVYLLKKHIGNTFEQIGNTFGVSKQQVIKDFNEVKNSPYKFARLLKPLETLIRGLHKGDIPNDY